MRDSGRALTIWIDMVDKTIVESPCSWEESSNGATASFE